MSRVFVVQEPVKRDQETGSFVPVMDFTPALRYGELKFCLKSGPVAFASRPTVERLREVFRDFKDDDYLVPTGDPAAIAIAAAVLTEITGGRFKMLKYDKREHEYVEISVITRLGGA